MEILKKKRWMVKSLNLRPFSSDYKTAKRVVVVVVWIARDETPSHAWLTDRLSAIREIAEEPPVFSLHGRSNRRNAGAEAMFCSHAKSIPRAVFSLRLASHGNAPQSVT